MYCSSCGRKIAKGSHFCDSCGAKVETDYKESSNVSSGQSMVIKVLSYIGILWIAGLFCGDKDEKDVKFHVGLGIMLSISVFVLEIILEIVKQVVVFSLFRTEQTLFGYGLGVYKISSVGLVVIGILYGALGLYTLIMAVIGIRNVLNDEEKQLPIIGKFAFYK